MISRSKVLLLLICFSLAISEVKSQYYSSGQDPASVKWEQIKTPNFKVIFPQGYERTAQYVANVLEYAAGLDTISLLAKAKNVPVILHNQTAISNAQTVWAPGRMNFYTIPPQDTYGQEWFQQLALHEYRHIIQISKLNQGLTHVLTYIFGEQITGAVLGLYVPLWFLEGDAVAAETELSNAGRGRSPSFAMPLRAQFLEEKIYTYDKAVFGSYKDFTPNHYILGYHIVAKSRQKFGTRIWNHTIDKIGRRPYMIVPFSEGIRDISGKNKTTLYRDMMAELKTEWQEQGEAIPWISNQKPLSSQKEIFTNYNRPHLTGSGNIIVEKRALDDIPRFVEIDKKGNEKVIHTPGYYLAGSLTYGQNNIAWTEYAYDPRWENRNFSVVKIKNLETGKVKVLKKKTRYFAPALSADGQKIVVVEVTENQEYKLLVLSTAGGETLFEYQSDGQEFFSYPSFNSLGDEIVVTTISAQGNSILLLNIETGHIEYLTGPTYTDISSPVFWGNNIVFIGAWSGINNLYLLNRDSKTIAQLTSVEYGLNDPFVSDEGKFLFADYRADGYRIVELEDRNENLIPLTKVEDNFVKLYRDLANQADTIMDPNAIPETVYTSKKYSKIGHLFNFHSWAPASIDVNNYEIKPGISLLSQNILSSAFASLGWEYDLNQETGRYFFNFTYEGWYPALDFETSYGKRKSYTLDTADNRIDFSWMETSIATNVRVPLNFTTNKYARFIQPSIEFEYLQLDMDDDAEVQFRRSNYKAISYRLYASNLLKRNFRDIYARWGQVLDLNYRTAPFENDTLGEMLSAETRLYFPGVFKHHSLNFYGGYQKRFDDNPLFSSIVNYTRGHSGLYTTELLSFKSNYAFPIIYPDLSLFSLAYIKRIRTNLFYDYAEGLHFGQTVSWQSLGAELFFDFHALRFLAPISFGYRFIYLPDENEIKNEFLFSISFDGL